MKKVLLFDPLYPLGTVAESPPQLRRLPDALISGNADSLLSGHSIGSFSSSFTNGAGHQFR
ncbi:hypothetical protein [Larkinella sp. C7]|jgi:hypothetical protein|uniref:hypothetical protein n=1 Tax=Larkinella sp. C7 TaxID=2576607 RepID=UPI0011112885|nr:hypothetical protein [Larkinella sp. C7]